MNWNEFSHNPFIPMALGFALFLAMTKVKPMLSAWWAAYSRRTDAIEALAQSHERAARLVDSMAEIQIKMMAGTTKACEAIVVATEKHRQTVAEFGKLVFRQNNDKEALQSATEIDKDRIYSEMAHRAAGKSDDEAAALAEEEAMRPQGYMTESGVL